MIRILKPGLFLYECLKILAIFTVLIIQRNDNGLFLKMVLAAPAVLFPLMGLFIWLDTNRYKAYLPLFTAGKCISLFLTAGWLIVSQQVTMLGNIFKAVIYAEAALFGGDLFALTAVLLIMKDNIDSTGELAKSEPEMIAEGEEN